MANKYLDQIGLSYFWSLIKEKLASITNRINEIELFKFPNATIIGQPVIQNGQISRFSVNDYLQFPFIVNFQGRPFNIDMCFTTGSDVTHQENILDSNFGLAFATLNRHFVLAMSTNGTSWDLGATSGAHTIQPNTTYYVRIAWDGSVYTSALSVDGDVYETDISVASAASLYPRQILIGVGDLSTAYPKVFSGTINLNKCSLTISDKVVWTGMDDVGLATRMAVDMSNIDDAGIAKVKEIVGDTSAGTYISPDAPTDDNVNLWLDTDEDEDIIVGGAAFVGESEPENPDVTLWINPEDETGAVLSVSQGGTGANNPADARTALGLQTLSLEEIESGINLEGKIPSAQTVKLEVVISDSTVKLRRDGHVFNLEMTNCSPSRAVQIITTYAPKDVTCGYQVTVNAPSGYYMGSLSVYGVVYFAPNPVTAGADCMINCSISWIA